MLQCRSDRGQSRKQGSSMLRKSILISIFVLGATPAFADMSSCYEPFPPAAVDGGTATEKQMKSALSDVKDFIKASDDYQTCMNSEFIAMQKKAKDSKDKTPIDPSIAWGATTSSSRATGRCAATHCC